MVGNPPRARRFSMVTQKPLQPGTLLSIPLHSQHVYTAAADG
jgi:hypothetical protein